MLAGDKLKESMRLQGKIVIDWEDQTYFINAEPDNFTRFCNSVFKSAKEINMAFSNEEFRENVQIDGMSWFEEETGNKHWVLYEDKMFSVASARANYLYFNDDQEIVRLPLNASSCKGMFKSCNLRADFKMQDFNPVNIVMMGAMFEKCVLPEGFVLGDDFDTSNVKVMQEMFFRCKIPDGFSLGNGFNTSNVTNMAGMFRGCKIPEGFSLGNGFNTRKVENMDGMFEDSTLPDGFSFGNKFSTSSLKTSIFMFCNTVLGEGVDLGNLKFLTL